MNCRSEINCRFKFKGDFYRLIQTQFSAGHLIKTQERIVLYDKDKVNTYFDHFVNFDNKRGLDDSLETKTSLAVKQFRTLSTTLWVDNSREERNIKQPSRAPNFKRKLSRFVSINLIYSQRV